MGSRRWELAVAVIAVAVAAAIAAFWITVNAHFLAHPGWLAVQKADWILGPTGVGLYWRLRRPDNRLGVLLIALGFCGVLYIFTSSTVPVLFGIGVLTEAPIIVLTMGAILAFPTGRLDGLAERGILLVLVLTTGLVYVIATLTAPQFSPSFSLSGCRAACPENGLAIWPPMPWPSLLTDVARAGVVVSAIATVCVLAWRFATGTPPRRRSLSIGAPIALVFLMAQATFQSLQLFSPNQATVAAGPISGAIAWTIAGARSAIWYGFLLALIGAQLYAGRVLRRLVRSALEYPSRGELEQMLREPLGDPTLRLAFWWSDAQGWAGADEARLKHPGPGQVMTEIDHDGRVAAAILHDEQLDEDPELVQAAGAIILLAHQNLEFEAGWKGSVRELAESRMRLVKASDEARRKLERDLHDGAQQRLLTALINLAVVRERADEPELVSLLAAVHTELEASVDELRDLAHGIYPTVLTDMGLAGALRSVALRQPDRITVTATEGRFPNETETALYFCCLEAVQNALKHAGEDAHITIRLFTLRGELLLEVRDTGSGFDRAVEHDGLGLQSMEDRLGAVGGQVEIRSVVGRGTLVAAAAPLG